VCHPRQILRALETCLSQPGVDPSPTWSSPRQKSRLKPWNRGINQCHRPHAFRIQRRIAEAYGSAETVSDEMCPFNAKLIQQAMQIRRHGGHCIALWWHISETVPTEVINGPSKAASQRRQNAYVPEGQIGEESMNHYQIAPLSRLLVVHIQTIDIGFWHRLPRFSSTGIPVPSN